MVLYHPFCPVSGHLPPTHMKSGPKPPTGGAMAANARPSHTTRRGHCRLDSCGTLSRTPNVPWGYGPTGARRQARSSFDKKRLTFCAKAGRCLAASPGDRELASSRIPPPQRSTPVPINHRDRSGREPRVFLVPEPPQKQILGQAVRGHASPETGAKQPVCLAFRQSGADGSHVFRPPFVLSGGWFLAHGYDLQRSESFRHRTTYCSTPDRRIQYLASRNL